MAMRLEKPDSGYAWVVVFAACIINGILSGMARMIGILYVAIIETYGVSRKEASLPFTVRNAIRYLSGPLVGILGQRYGIRSVTFAGGIIAALGSVLCCVAPTVTWISVFWGGVHGLGFSLANTLFQVVVNQYFVRHRATASGIVLSGACFGSLVFPLMLGGLLDEYGLVGCFLVLGGLFLNVSPPALVLRVPPWIENPEGYARKKALLERLSEAEADATGYRNINKVRENRKNYCRSLSNCSISEFDVHHLSNTSSKTFINKFGGPNSKKLKFNNELNESKVEVNVICTSYCAINTALRIGVNKQECNRIVIMKQNKVRSETSQKM
ncbi:hypothetical protein JTE90_029298 [Oedothorax gibbosus]|uniref:Monocarboxylate transporter n=1 Tax=Oedothorax gibbosus TaxID=931172 RepID=A0AAV6U416_9ARAC|nr:hypothetical protein JTE90_029298 [Oedothorax gibbosus]